MSSALRRLIAGGCTVVLLIVGVQLLGITAASAHSNIVSGSPTCVAATGHYQVTWTITNDWKNDAENVTVNSYTPSGASLSTHSLSLNKAPDSGTITETNIPGNATSASLSVQGLWADKYTQPNSGSVTLGGTCQPDHSPAAPSWHNGKCDSNFQQVSPTVTIPSDTDVSYTLDGSGKSAGTYPTSADAHKIVASSTKLTLTGTTSWSFTLTAAPGDCNTTVTPVKPTVTQSKCDDSHHPTKAMLNVPSTLGITYTPTSGSYNAGDSVTVTAIASDGYEFVNNHDAWTFVNSKKETLTITFDNAPDCTVSVTPVLPDATQSVCSGQDPTDPTLAFKTTEGIAYTADPSGGWQAGDPVLVTATLTSAVYKFSAATTTNGWTVAGNKATKSFTFDAAPDCRTVITPESPTVVQSDCPVGGHFPTVPSLTYPSTTGVLYSQDIPTPTTAVTTPVTVLVTATAQGKYKFAAAAPKDWTRVSDTKETYTVTFTKSPDCRAEATPAAPTLTQAACPATGTTLTAPTLTLVPATGVTYAPDKDAPYTAGEIVTVTANTASGYKFAAALPAGWSRDSDTKATYVVTFDAGFACTVPESPGLTQSVCPSDGTTPTAPTLTYKSTDGVLYSVDQDAPYHGGQVVTVKATAQPGHEFDTTAPGDWVWVSDTVETLAVTFADSPQCAQTVTPTFTNDECASSVPTSATYTIASTPGVDYYVNSVLTTAGKYTATDGSTITVEAKPQAGYTLVGTSSWSHEFPATPDCVQSAKVVKATFTTDKCVNGTPRGATYTVPSTTGVSYTVNGKSVTAGTYKASSGSTVTIVATAQPGYTLEGTTSWSQAFGATPQCHGTDAQTVHKPTSPTGPLAVTGVPTATLLGVGIGLLLVGGACTFLAASRRRRTNG
jgi:hypothetical protein